MASPSDHYIDIQLKLDPELPAHLLMAALYGRLHTLLTQQKAQDIGVSFPGYQKTPAQLGSVLRLFGASAALEALADGKWLGAVREHVSLQPMQPVPSTAAQRSLRRVQAKSSPARLRRRQMRRHGLSEAEALARLPDSAAEHLKLPFVQLRSASTGQSFRLFLELGPPQQTAISEGDFNSYGLSTARTVPWF